MRPIAREVMIRVAVRDHGLCRYCGAPATEYDHVQPVKTKGVSDYFNLVLACKTCNQRKQQAPGFHLTQEGDLYYYAVEVSVAGLFGSRLWAHLRQRRVKKQRHQSLQRMMKSSVESVGSHVLS